MYLYSTFKLHIQLIVLLHLIKLEVIQVQLAYRVGFHPHTNFIEATNLSGGKKRIAPFPLSKIMQIFRQK